MGKKQKRRTVGPPGPEHFAALATGKVIAVRRIDTIARVMDTAIWLWFFEKDPLCVHLLTLAAYQCLDDLGKKSGKGPRLKSSLDAQQFTTAYDFLRHASSSPNAGILFAPSVNGPILFDSVAAFNRIFGNLTMYMRSFWAYFILHPEPPIPKSREKLLQHPDLFLPKAVTIKDAMKLGRLEFFAELTEMFAVQYGSKADRE